MAQQTGGRSKAVIFLALAMAVATFASLAVYRVLQESKKQLEEAQKPPETFPVAVATRDLYMGIPIGLEDVAVRELLPEMIPPEVTFSTLEEVVGRTPRERILSNEMIRTERLARRDAGIGLNALITPGKRAMSVTTGVSTSVAGFARPGNFVDIMVTIAPQIEELGNGNDFITETILQQVKVLAVGSTLEREDEKKPQNQAPQNSLTVEVTLEEAEKLALAVSKGTLFVVLRSDVDIAQTDQDGRRTDIGVLIGFDPEKEKPASTPHVIRTAAKAQTTTTAEVVSGSDTKQIEFGEDGAKQKNK